MGSFLIDSYKLRLELVGTRNPVVTTRNRIIELTASPVIIGIMERAVLAFSTVMISGSGTPAIGFYDSSNPCSRESRVGCHRANTRFGTTCCVLRTAGLLLRHHTHWWCELCR